MNKMDIEKLYLKSLDSLLSEEENRTLEIEFARNSMLKTELLQYNEMRRVLQAKEPATFGPYFATKLIYKIQNTGLAIDREIFWFFKKFQLAAIGVVVTLLLLNIFFSGGDLMAALGLDASATSQTDIVSFDYSELFNDDL